MSMPLPNFQERAISTNSYFAKGGLNLRAGPLDTAPGEAIQLNNYEIDEDGHYRRIDGFERFDGQSRPSEYLPTGQLTDEAYLADLIAGTEARRALIQPVPGSGPIRGVVQYNGVVYAFRDNAGGTECKMYEATGAGWSEIVTGVTINAGGDYRFDIANMENAGASGIKLYGACGVDQAFVFDGTTFTQITTGAEPNYPNIPKVFKNHLFLAYDSGSLQHSAIGDPVYWTGVNGASELGISDDITNLETTGGNSLFISSKNRIDVLSGASAADWVQTTYSDSVGMKAKTPARMNDIYFFDDIGITQLKRVQAFGDFQSASVSSMIEPFIRSRLANATCATSISRKYQ